MRSSALLLILALTLPFVTAVTTLHSGTVYPGDEIIKGDRNYTIGSSSDPYALYLIVDGEDYVVSYGTCRRSRSGFEEYCYDQSDFMDCRSGNYDCPDVEEHNNDTSWCCPYDVQNVRFVGGDAQWGAQVLLTRLGEPQITLSRESEPDALEALALNEEVALTLTFRNTGDQAMTGGRFVEELPSGFSFLPLKSDNLFSWSAGTLSLKVNLGAGDEQSYVYTLRPVRYASGELNGSFNYEQRGEERHLFPTPLTLTAPEPYTLTQSITERLFDDERGTYTLLVNNTSGRRLNLTVQLFNFHTLFPEDPPGFERANYKRREFVLARELDVDEVYLLNQTVDPEEPGWYTVTSAAAVTVAGKEYLETWSGRTISTRRTLTPAIVLPESVAPGERFSVRALVDNTGSATDFSVLGATLTSTHHDEQQGAGGAVLGGTIRNLLETEFTAPNVTTPENITFKLTGEYEEQGMQQQSFRTERTLLVIPAAAANGSGTNATGQVAASDAENTSDGPVAAGSDAATVEAAEGPVDETGGDAMDAEVGGDDATDENATATEEPAQGAAEGGFIVRFLNGLAAWLKGFF